MKLQLEGSTDQIEMENADTITGQFDILAINNMGLSEDDPFGVLVVEAKNSAIDLSAGLPQLLIYACKSLEYQPSTWGLVTNGSNYQFVYLTCGKPSTYQILLLLHLFEPERTVQLLQALKPSAHYKGQCQSRQLCKLPLAI